MVRVDFHAGLGGARARSVRLLDGSVRRHTLSGLGIRLMPCVPGCWPACPSPGLSLFLPQTGSRGLGSSVAWSHLGKWPFLVASHLGKWPFLDLTMAAGGLQPPTPLFLSRGLTGWGNAVAGAHRPCSFSGLGIEGGCKENL